MTGCAYWNACALSENPYANRCRFLLKSLAKDSGKSLLSGGSSRSGGGGVGERYLGLIGVNGLSNFGMSGTDTGGTCDLAACSLMYPLAHIASGITSSRSASNFLNPDFSNPGPNIYGDLFGYFLCSLLRRPSTSCLTFITARQNIPSNFSRIILDIRPVCCYL